MKFDVILNAAPQTHQFPIIRLEDGTPCIVGDDSCKVFLADGGQTAIHPYPDPNEARRTKPTKHLCEIHSGDFVGIRAYVDGTIYIRVFRVDDVSGSHVRYTIV